jgi:hypothetical protein
MMRLVEIIGRRPMPPGAQIIGRMPMPQGGPKLWLA